MFYWDTSALVKQFIQEVGTSEAIALRANAPPHATATIAYTETFSALRRRVRETALRESQYDDVVRRFVREWPAYVRVNLDERILGRTRALLERYPLRTLDAIHLASAIELQDHLDEPSVVISADTQLLRAATAEHLETKRLPL
ncbi:MAG: type II toxin-antitoxin system VapC family toxin [Nitrospira sp.]|nr:type II toxin-antitoxin system VapC family toxin [Nitrospira sp.]MDH4370152.1 type II toxin-antitoxin system VapC family toxin [Nitrospira sp.]MDH5347358.1 type II toxin-antitoxin system VapC family toxin [Nitrospira sp.]MDH5497680.1 type II toxin-antitoxin system VapC family toxin [Nitrospira sp.]MDH5725085.1 type II toxin-antitoxin system VapC family toxin [Nitrospira sp.]